MRWVHDSLTIDDVPGAYAPTCTIRLRRADRSVYVEHLSGDDTHRVLDRAAEIVAEQESYVPEVLPPARPWREVFAEELAADEAAAHAHLHPYRATSAARDAARPGGYPVDIDLQLGFGERR